ncbi:ornithine--oxo-acid transaminase [Nocardia pseudovaccinii]|uniref:ornithine--oxo-acid transaminase n=1 Tax=Nocardia pseudovaccinii TaxID=189540 RepID=UPI003D93878D
MRKLEERSERLRALELAYGARNYDPLPVVLTHGQGVWVEDLDGNRYFDALAGASALNFGHRHPRLVEAAHRQLDRLTLTTRHFHNDQFPELCAELAEFAGKQRVLPMNTGVEAVETGIKIARKWGYEYKGIAPDKARIIVCEGNFHGRTLTAISPSSDARGRAGFGPFTPGFVTVPFGDAAALRAAVDDNTVAILVEPVQYQRGPRIPPADYLAHVAQICSVHDILLVADEVWTGLGRTGRHFACEHGNVEPDIYLLGKSLGGGIAPISAVVGNENVMDVMGPGIHGSTYSGNPLGSAVARAALAELRESDLAERSGALGARAAARLAAEAGPAVQQIRQCGLWLALDIDPAAGTARDVCERLLDSGILTTPASAQAIRIVPPLVTTTEELDWMLDRMLIVLDEAARHMREAADPAM